MGRQISRYCELNRHTGKWHRRVLLEMPLWFVNDGPEINVVIAEERDYEAVKATGKLADCMLCKNKLRCLLDTQTIMSFERIDSRS